MSDSYGFFIGMPKDLLLAEIDASLERAFADLQQRAVDRVRELILVASCQQVQSHVTSQEHAISATTASGNWSAKLPTQTLQTPISGDDSALSLSLAQQDHAEGDAQFDKSSRSTPIAQRGHPQGAAQCDFQSPSPSLTQGSEEGQRTPQSSVPANNWNPSEFQIEDSLTSFDMQRQNSKGSANSSDSKRQGSKDGSFKRRPSLSQADFEALRHEFDRQETPPNIGPRKLKASSIEPKDLHFEKMAARKGLCWNELSLIDQAGLFRDELASTSFTIDPQSDPMRVWDMLVMGCLVFTAIVLPYEAAFLESDYGVLYFINHTIDVVFLSDMVLQFFLKVRVRTKHRTRWVKKRSKIAINYFKSWFAVDLLSIIPYDDISNLLSSGKGSSLQHLAVMRLLRVLRLLKLFRMLKATRLAKRWENRNSLQSSTKHLAKGFLLIMVSAHWMACIWGFFGVWEGSNLKCRSYLKDDDPLVVAAPAASWYIDVGEGSAPNDPSAWRGQSWVVAFAMGRAASNPFDPCSHISLYIVSMYWAIMTMTSIGYGDILPQVVGEYVVNCLCMLVSGILWAYVIGVASAVLCNMYPETMEFEQRLDAFNTMVIDMQVPTKIRQLGREYLRESRYKWSHERNLAVIQSLGFDLKVKISKQSAKLYLGAVALFSRFSELFCADCAARMAPHFFEPHFFIDLPTHLCVIEKGAVGHAGNLLVPWKSWGQDFIVQNPQLRLPHQAVALSYAMVVSLSKDKLEIVLVEHPLERSIFARAAVCLAFKGAMRLYLADLETLCDVVDVGSESGEHVPPEHKWIHDVMDGRFLSKPSTTDGTEYKKSETSSGVLVEM